MGRDITIAGVTALVTSILTFFTASSLGLFEDAVKDLGAQRVAEQMINDDDLFSLMMYNLAEDGRFRGDDGKDGRDGVDGKDGTTIGEPQVFQVDAGPKDSPRSADRALGRHLYCAIYEHRHPHASQACSCSLGLKNQEWSLAVSVDEGVKGSCSCSAICFGSKT